MAVAAPQPNLGEQLVVAGDCALFHRGFAGKGSILNGADLGHRRLMTGESPFICRRLAVQYVVVACEGSLFCGGFAGKGSILNGADLGHRRLMTSESPLFCGGFAGKGSFLGCC